MASYLTSILTTTTSRYTSLKRSLLPDESDGDTEDDSHISRVLRAYYTEKGRPFPQWLPPDPKAPQPPPPQPMYLNNPAGSGVGRGAAAPTGRGGALSDLWDSPSQGGPPPQEESLSLRRGGRGPGRMQNPPAPGPAGGGIVDSYTNARPLPSQRAGSYQSQFSQQSSASQSREQDNYSPPPSSSSSSVTAQERLKARLWGSGNAAGRSGSPTSSQSAFSPPPSLSPRRTPVGSTGPPSSLPPGRAPTSYDRPGPGVGGGSGYSSRSQSGGNSGGADDSYKPYLGSSAPWSTGEEDYNDDSGGRRQGVGGGRSYGDQGGSDGAGRGSRGRGMGTYNGRIVGLPSGPRYK